MGSLRFVAHSEVGKVRKNNQDSGYASPTMLLVADGMGGAAAGDLASAVAVTELSEIDERLSGEAMLEAMSGGMRKANDKLSALVGADLSLDGMGTTVCGAMFSGNQFALAHIGDSRGYLLRDGELHRLTHDHSFVQSLVDEGKITPEQAETHPHRSLLLKVLNGQPTHEADYELVDAEVGDRVMFCSDGLCGLVRDSVIATMLALPDLDQAVAKLAEAANEAGGLDNITIVAAEVAEDDPELDAASPITVGAADARDIPEVADPTTMIPLVRSPEDDEADRYAPETRRFRWAGSALILALVATMLTLGGWAAVSYARTKYFVGAEDGHVAIYQGVPGEFLGIRLSEVAETQDTLVADLPRFYQDAVASGIPVNSLDAARTTATELHAKAQRCIKIRKERDTPPSPTPSPSMRASTTPTATAAPGTAPSSPRTPSASANPGVSLSPTRAPLSPYPNQPSDPEEC